MQIFNTLTRQKEEFVPQVPGEYRIYVCGPTVYNYIHIGNARPLIVFDTLRRYLEYRGNKVIYVSNITDIDDKLIKKGQEEGTSMKEVAQRFEAEYLKDAAGLNCKKPTVQPRATEHIQQILDIVKDLIDSGHAYVAKNGDVYFRVKSDPSYGKLSHLKLDDLESGNRETGVQRHEPHPSGQDHRPALRRSGSDLPPPRERDRPERVRQRLRVCPLLDAQRLHQRG